MVVLLACAYNATWAQVLLVKCFLLSSLHIVFYLLSFALLRQAPCLYNGILVFLYLIYLPYVKSSQNLVASCALSYNGKTLV